MTAKLVFRSKKSDEHRVTNKDKIDEEPLNVDMFECMQRMGRAGAFEFVVLFKNDSYVGFD
jgi:hypothetical protein